jgi:hypothetical protein
MSRKKIPQNIVGRLAMEGTLLNKLNNFDKEKISDLIRWRNCGQTDKTWCHRSLV